MRWPNGQIHRSVCTALHSQLGTWPVKACPCSKACHRTFSSSLSFGVSGSNSWFTLLSFPKSNYYRKKTTRQAKLLKTLAGVHVGAVDLIILRNCPRGRIGAHVGAVSNFISFVEGGVAVLLGLILLFQVFIVLVVHRILLGRVGKALLLVGAIIGPITMLLAASSNRS